MPGPVATAIFDDAKGVGGAEQHHRAAMKDMLAAGMSPGEAAERILAGIAAGDFWVSTHPELTQQTARMRAEYLANLAVPGLAEAAREISGL